METPSNIPVPLTSFIGRQKDLKEIAALLAASRLLTLTGPGGVGKTRLAIHTARDCAGKFKDGVCWVELAALRDESLVPQEIGQALAIREVSTGPLIETIKGVLRPKELLLVLDNCEHLIEACARCAEQLLGACPKLKILATSREGLGLFNELTWHVPSLPVPEPRPDLAPGEVKGFAGIQLFVERAAHARPGFVLNDQNAFQIAQICHRLDGIPLALELAAARMKVLLPEDIAARLDDRFSVLTSGSRTALLRHQTLRATIDWSYDLLSESERILFRRLAVFFDGFSLEAAEYVCGQGDLRRADILDLLGRLVDKSLVNVEQVSLTGDTRYRFLETIHQYAAEKLDQAGEFQGMRDQHLLYFTDLAERTGKNIFSQAEAVWLSRTESEIENLRGALTWSITETEEEPGMDASWRSRSGLQLAGALVWFWAWFMQNSYGQDLTERLKLNLSRGDAKVPTLARARALNAVGFVHYTMNRLDDARAFLDEALEIAREGQDQHTLAWTLSYLGTVLTGMGQIERARSLLEQALELARKSGRAGKPIVGVTLVYLGDIAYLALDDARAHSLYEESIASLRESHNLNLLAYADRRWGYLFLRQAELRKAAPLFKESVTLNHRLGHRIGFAAALAGCAAHALADGKLLRAAKLMGAVEGSLAQSDAPLFAIDETERERTLQALHSRLDEKTFARTCAKGRAMTAEEAMRFALERP